MTEKQFLVASVYLRVVKFASLKAEPSFAKSKLKERVNPTKKIVQHIGQRPVLLTEGVM